MALRTERTRASRRVMKVMGVSDLSGWGTARTFLWRLLFASLYIGLNGTAGFQTSLAYQDQDACMDVDSGRYISTTASTSNYPSIPALPEWNPADMSRPQAQTKRRSKRDLLGWTYQECETREDIIDMKDTIIRCQRRKIRDLMQRLKEATDRLMASEMQDLVMNIESMSLDSDNP
jgi:hypothetical protein